MPRKQIDDFLFKILRPKLVGVVGIILFVALIAVTIYYAGPDDWPSDLPWLERRGALAVFVLIGIMIFVVAARRRRRKLDREGITGVAEVLQVDTNSSDARYPNGLLNVTLRLRFSDVGAAIEPLTYVIFRVPPRRFVAEALVPGERRPVRLLPGDLSVVMLQRELTEGKPFECRLRVVQPDREDADREEDGGIDRASSTPTGR